MKCPYSALNNTTTFKKVRESLRIFDLSDISEKIDRVLKQLLNTGEAFKGICDLDSHNVKNAPRWSKVNFIETSIYWNLMKEIIQVTIKEILIDLESEKQLSTNENNYGIINNSIIVKLSKEKSFEEKSNLIGVYILDYFISKISREISNIELEHKSGANENKHQLYQLINIISKEYSDEGIGKSEFIKLFINIGIGNTIGNSILMIQQMKHKLGEIDINLLRECLYNSSSFFIDISRSNVFLHYIMSKKRNAYKYNIEKNCFELNINEEEIKEISKNIKEDTYFVSCPMLYWKTSFFGKKSNGILDFQKLTFEIIIMIMQRANIIK